MMDVHCGLIVSSSVTSRTADEAQHFEGNREVAVNFPQQACGVPVIKTVNTWVADWGDQERAGAQALRLLRSSSIAARDNTVKRWRGSVRSLAMRRIAKVCWGGRPRCRLDWTVAQSLGIVARCRCVAWVAKIAIAVGGWSVCAATSARSRWGVC